MRRGWLLAAVVAAWALWRSGDSHDEALAALPGAGDPARVVMVSAEWCGYCQRQLADFEAANVRFTLLDFDQPSGRGLVDDLGGSGVPLTVIGDEIIHGYNRPLLQQHLAEIGYSLR